MVLKIAAKFAMTPQEHTHAEALEAAERDAQAMLGVSLSEAFRLLDSGRLDGTVAEAELRMARFLLDR